MSPATSSLFRVSETAVRDLRASFRGELLRPADAGYEEARKIWNGMIDRRPALIARCTGVADVMLAVRFAQDHGLLVAVRGGGHNVAGNAVCDEGIVIDLSRMKGIWIDPTRRTACAQPGLTWGEFDRETQAFGLALTGGIQSTTGIAGFTLGGGFGYLARKHGLTCDNLLSVDVVTADGRFIVASTEEHPDLFWGVRGGGGNFGIVTSFEFQLYPLGPVLGGLILHPLAKARELLRFYREFIASAPDELFTIIAFVSAPATPAVPEELRGKPAIAIIACYAGSVEEGLRTLEPLRKFGPPAADLVGPKPYVEMQTLLDAANPPGLQNYWKAEFLRGYSQEAIETILAFAARRPSQMSKILIAHLGGAIQRVGHEETAYIHRDAPILLNINAMWSDPRDSDMAIAWARDFWSAMRPHSAGGVYVNFLSDEGQDRVQAAYDPRTYERLVALKDKYDSANFFRLNQNIPPSTARSAP